VLDFLRERPKDSGIIYCASRAGADGLASKLTEDGIKAAPYHAGMEKDDRGRSQDKFLRDEVRVVCATIAFGMGINKPNVRFVVHYDLPKNVEGYYQETGRAGRDGAPADAWMTYGLGDVVQQRRMIDQSEGSEEYRRVQVVKLDALLGLCETAGCRRVRLLDYFGEPSAPCGNCDTCLEPPQTWDATEAARKALSCMYRTGQRFGAVHLIDVLRGRSTERTTQWGHEQLNVFGIGADLDEAAWRNVFRQLVALGYAEPDHDAFGALKLTEASRPVLKGGQSVEMRQLQPRKGKVGKARSAVAAGLSSADAGLLDQLKAWRLEQAREQAVPAYVILHDRTLAEIAASRPQDMDALGMISGIGAKKLELYSTNIKANDFVEQVFEINQWQEAFGLVEGLLLL
jgi:ATP-dependent DNA helicase RecQ